MDGLNVLKKLWASHSEIPFILLSEKTNEEEFFQIRSHGITAFVAKPFKIPNLLNAIMR